MFKSPRIILLLPGALCIGITLFAGMLLVKFELRTSPYWYTIGALMMAEAMLFLTLMDIGGNHRDRAMPHRIGNVLVSVFYLFFTLIMLIPYMAGASADAIRLLQVIGLFAALTLHILFGLAHRAVDAQARQFAAERADIVNFRIEVESFRVEYAELLRKTPELHKEMQELSDAVRFAPESVAGAEAVDFRIAAAFERLKKSAQGENVDSTELADGIRELLTLFRKRQILIRELR